MRTTHTYAILEVAPEIYKQIHKQLKEAGYDHAFHTNGDDHVIDMNGIALKAKPDPRSKAWETYLAGWLHANGTTIKELGLSWSGTGGENQLKRDFATWYESTRDIE